MKRKMFTSNLGFRVKIQLPLILGIGLILISFQSQCAVINDLFATGLDSSGNILGGADADPHYTVLDGVTPGMNAVTLFSIPSVYVPNDSSSRWVWENSSGYPINVTRTFRTTFDLTGFDPITASISGTWATDNLGLDILINGISTGLTNSTFTSYTPFVITNGFVAGVNTLDFVVQDVGGISGFRVGSLTGTADFEISTVPLPSSLLLFASAFIGMGFRGKLFFNDAG